MKAHPEIFKARSDILAMTLPQQADHRRKATHDAIRADMVFVAGGAFRMGSDRHYPEEAPAHDATVDGFWIDRFPVTNDRFSRFVYETGYETSAERAPNPADYPGAKPEMLVAASVVFRQPKARVDMANHFNWWAYVPGANWRHPLGPRSTLKGKGAHPAVHIAYDDAIAYAQWAGKSLPTEAEWEFAARGGLDGADFAWGDELTPGGVAMANTWQGQFPYVDLAEDGYEGTSPVGIYPPNRYGLYDMIGNVWEWTTDWYEDRHKPASSCCGGLHGGDREASFDPNAPDIRIPRKVMKGGSYLCAPNYCQRYRPAARMAQPVDTGTCHLGFRCMTRAPG